jgi:hypothetical protein
MDKAPDAQWAENSFKHAMRDGTKPQTTAEARERANDFVKQNLRQAEALLCKCGDAWSYLHALRYFGYALHTVQDSTSPAHNRYLYPWGPIVFRRWHGWNGLNTVDPINVGRALTHVLNERFDPGDESELDQATLDLWSYFTCARNAPPLPNNFFTYDIDQNF